MQLAGTFAADLGRSAAAEPRSVAILCFADVPPDEVRTPFRLLARGAPALQVGLVAPKRGPVRTAAGTEVVASYALDDPALEPDELLVPCCFVRSRDFAGRADVEGLVKAVRGARRVWLAAASRQEARQAQLTLRAASSLPEGAFWGRRSRRGPGGTEIVEDGHLTWAIGPGAGPDLVARLLRQDRRRTSAAA